MTDLSNTIVTITGVNGYLGEYIVKVVLQEGYRVRGTVRDPTNVEKLKVLMALPGASERLTLYKADLLQPGSFDEAIEGARYVIHSASPVALEVLKDPENMLVRPAVEGTKNVLGSCVNASSVKRVVLTSSFRSVFGLCDEHPQGYIYTEEDWNTKSSLENEQGYALSKVAAERAAWEIANKQSKWDMVVINPGLIFGPLLSSNHADSFSIKMIKTLVTGELPVVKLAWPVVDVRDVAKAHCVALTHPTAKGRYLINSGTLSLRQIVDLVRDKIRRPLLRFSVLKPFLWIGFYTGVVGNRLSKTDIIHNVGFKILFTNEKTQRDLVPEGLIKPRQTFREMYDSLVEHKLLSATN